MFPEDGRLEPERSGDSQPQAARRANAVRQMDNNLVENAIRTSAIGKKNWMFIQEARAGMKAATFYTLVGNCQQLGVDAHAYLLDLFTRLPKMTNRQMRESRLKPRRRISNTLCEE